MKRLALLLLVVPVGCSARSGAETRGLQCEAVSVTILDLGGGDAGLTAALGQLKRLVAARNKTALATWVSPDLAFERDFGRIFVETREPIENLAFAYGFASSSLDPDGGWVQLARDLEGPFWKDDGLVCGPPSYDSVVLPRDAGSRDVFSTGFVVGDVVVRARASHEAAPVAQLTNPLFEVDWDPAKWKDDSGIRWLAVSDSCSRRGFVPLDRVRTLLDRQLCMEFDGNAWRIRKLVLGGD